MIGLERLKWSLEHKNDPAQRASLLAAPRLRLLESRAHYAESKFKSVDPAPAEERYLRRSSGALSCLDADRRSGKKKRSVAELRDQLVNPANSLYVRYKAMFALRNIVSAGRSAGARVMTGVSGHGGGGAGAGRGLPGPNQRTVPARDCLCDGTAASSCLVRRAGGCFAGETRPPARTLSPFGRAAT